jgi:hypothetical protein
MNNPGFNIMGFREVKDRIIEPVSSPLNLPGFKQFPFCLTFPRFGEYGVDFGATAIVVPVERQFRNLGIARQTASSAADYGLQNCAVNPASPTWQGGCLCLK